MKLKSIQYFLERTTPFASLARYQRGRRLQKKLRRWEQGGQVLPMAHLGKQQVVLDYIRDFGLDVFVETGTYKGHMVYAVMPYISRIYSIEIDETLCRKAQRRFSGYRNITILQGQSGDVLPTILERINQPCLFWLDAHYSGGSTGKGDLETPIIQELRTILAHPQPETHVILIDDARCFTGQNDYPEIRTVEKLIISLRPNWLFTVKDDIIRAHPGGRGPSLEPPA
ncbi:MAG: hypothetical protein ACYTAS_10845 [Planctomycetota bacterium]